MYAPALLTGLTLALGLVRLGSASIWLDEAASVNLARIPFGDFLSVAADKEANMSLYYVLLRGWLRLGDSEFTIRLLSAIAAAATIPVLYALGARLFGRRVAIMACALCSVGGFFLRYAHEARGYSLAALAATSLTLLLVRAIEEPSRGRWIAYGGAAGVGLYTHFFVGFVILAHVVIAAAVRRDRWRDLIAGAGVAAALALPLGIFLLGQEGAQVAWIPRTTLRTVVPTFKALTGFGGIPLLLAYFVACAAGSVAVWRGERALRWKGALVLAWVAVPPALAFAVSLSTPIVRPQYLIVMVPGLALLAAIGLDSLRRPTLVGAGTALLLGLSVAALPRMYSNLETHDWRSAARFVLQRGTPADGAVFYAYYGWTPFWYYAESSGASPPDLVYPRGAWSPPSTIGSQPLSPHLAAIAARERIWLVLNNARTDRPAPELAQLLAMLGTAFERTDYREFVGGIRVGLYERIRG